MTRLTLPVAGVSPGRAANRSTPVEPSQAGAALAGFGQLANQVATKLQDDLLDRELKRAQVDLTRDVNDLRLQVEQIGDPDAADQAWMQGVEALRARYTQPDETGRAPVNKLNENNFGLMFDGLTNSVAFDIGRRNLGLRNAEREATWINYTQTAVNAAARANPETRSQIVANGFDQIDSLVAAGIIDAAEGERRRQGLVQEVDNARAIRMVADDPAGFISAAQSGDFAGLPGDAIARYEVQAQSRIETIAKQQATEAERIERERQAEIGDRLTDMRQIMAAGRDAVDEAFLMDPAAQAHPEYARTMAAKSLQLEGNLLTEMSTGQIDALIAAEKTRKLKEPWEAERLTLLEEWRDRHDDGYRKDPVGHQQSLGLSVIDLPEFDPANPAPFLRALDFRRRDAERLVAEGYTSDYRLFSDEERDGLNKLASVETDPATRVALAGALAQASPETADRVTSIIADPVFGHVSGYIGAGGTQATAEGILRGQRILSEKTVILPPERDRKSEAFNHLKGYFASQPVARDVEASVIAAADALYATKMRQTGPADDIDDAVYRQAVHEVLGGTGAYSGRDAKGGMQDYNDAPTPLPPGVGVRDIDTTVMELRRNLRGLRTPTYLKSDTDAIALPRFGAGVTVRPVTRHTSEEARALGEARLQAASLSGGLPVIDGSLIDDDVLGEAQFRAMGPDRYQLILDDLPIQDGETGRAYEFSLTRLLQEVRK